MVDPSQLITALQGLITQLGGSGNVSPSGTATFNIGEFPTLPAFLPSYAIEEFDGVGGQKQSQSTIDLGPGGNAIIIYVRANPNVVTSSPQCSITVLDSPTPAGPFVSPSGDTLVQSSLLTLNSGGRVQNFTGVSASRYVVTGLQRFVKLNVSIQAGGFIITWAATVQNGPATQAQALYPAGTTGTIPAANAATIFTIPLGTLTGGSAGAVFDARQVYLLIANTLTLVNIISAGLVFTETGLGGEAFSIVYALPGFPMTSGTSNSFTVALNKGYLRNMSLSVAFASAPAAGSVDVQTIVSGANGDILNSVQSTLTDVAATRATSILHRSAITAADVLALPGTLTLTDDGAQAGATLPNAALHVLVSAGNRWGPTGVGADPGTITPTLNHAVRLAFAQVVGADYYDIFISSAANALGVGRITEAQRAAGGFIINTVGTVTAGGAAPAGSVDLGIVGTGLASNVNPFAVNNAYTPGLVASVQCTGFSEAHLYVKLAVTDLRVLPTLVITPFFATATVEPFDWYAGPQQVVNILTAVGQVLEQDIVLTIDGANSMVVLVQSIAGDGAAASVRVELA